MKYFVKYLPVEGEIRAGDMYHNGNGIGPHYEGEIEPVGKKVKLFLCSGDIQAKDRVWDEYNGFYEADLMLYQILQKGTYGLEFVPVKVIGEISPEALWVEEGDEFEKEDLFANGVGLNWDENYKDYKFKVKCPVCKTFH